MKNMIFKLSPTLLLGLFPGVVMAAEQAETQMDLTNH